jgi:6-phosphofructokinase 1
MDPYVHGDGLASVSSTVQRTGIDTLVVIGGDGTLRTALRLSKEGLAVVGVPKTIDNDISATDTTFGFDTAVHVATEAIDRIATTAEAHDRLGIVEVMGRHQGWIALYAGIAGGADAILVPEVPYDLDEVAQTVRARARRGLSFSIIVVAEGVPPPPESADRPMAKDAFGFERLGGVAYQIAPALEERTGFESRVTILGHTQRGGTPTAADRVLATRLGAAAADLAVAGANQVMTAVRGEAIVAVDLEEACTQAKGVPAELYQVAKTFFS